jgi:hypothetical protein
MLLEDSRRDVFVAAFVGHVRGGDRDAVVQFGEISEPEPEPERTVLTVWFGVLQGENQNRTEKPIISESG